LGIALRQTQALSDDRLDDFLECMSTRRTIFEELRALESPAPANLVDFPLSEPAPSDGEIRALIPALVAAVIEQDAENERLLRARLCELRDALLQLGQGLGAARGYAEAVPKPGRPGLLNVAR